MSDGKEINRFKKHILGIEERSLVLKRKRISEGWGVGIEGKDVL